MWFPVSEGEVYSTKSLYIRAYYKLDKTFLSSVNGNGTFTIPEDVAYMRISTLDLNGAQLNRGDELLDYDEYREQTLSSEIKINNLPDNIITTPLIKNNAVTEDKVSFIKQSTNLINKDKLIDGYAVMYSSNGEPVANSTNSVTEFIKVEPNTPYTESTNSHRVAYYDENKVYIGQDYSGNKDSFTFTTPINARYVRLNVYTTRRNDSILNKGTELLPYEDWHEPIIKGALDYNSVSTSNILDNVITPEKTTFVKRPKNLIDKNSLIQGKALNSKGEVSDNSMFYITDYVPIKENETYTASSSSQNKVIFYDKDKNYIDSKYNPEDTITFTTPERTAYVRLNVHRSFKDTPMLNEGTELLPYEDWHEPYLEGITTRNNIDSEKITKEIIQQIDSKRPQEVEEVVSEVIKRLEEENTQTEVPINVEEVVSEVIKRLEEESIKDRKTFTFDTSLDLNYIPETIQGCSDDDTLPMSQIQYTDFYNMYDELCNKYPNYVSRKVEGKDILEDEIISYTFKPEEQSFTHNSEEVEKTFKRFKFFIVSSTHGNERTSIWVLYNLMKLICEKWQTDEALEFLRWNVEFVICPVISPSGYRNFTRINANGVDLNRNFDADWENGTSDKSNTTYRGDAPMSEPESIVCDNIIKRENPNFVIDFHNFHAQSTPTSFNWIIGYSDKINDIADLVLSKMARKWKKQYPDLPQDVVGFGYGSPGIQVGSLTNYAQKKYGIPSSLFEVCWKMDAKTDSTKRDSFISTIGLDSFSNFLLQIAINANEL